MCILQYGPERRREPQRDAERYVRSSMVHRDTERHVWSSMVQYGLERRRETHTV